MFNAISPELKVEVLDQLPIPVYRCDRDGYITSYNQPAVELWGKTPETGITRWCGSLKMFSSDGRPLMHNSCPMAVSLEEELPINGEHIIIERPDGTRRRVRSYPVPLFDENKKLTGAINTLVDITEIVQGEEKQATLAAIVDTSDDAIISKTLKGIITSWNKAAERLFGYSEEEAIGEHISLVIPEERMAEEDYIIGEIISGNKVDHFETIRVTKDGTRIPLSISVSPVVNKDGVIIGASKIARDISERNKDDERRKQFISLASHELKTPLTTIMGYMQILDSITTDERSKRFVGKTRQQIKRLSQLVSDLVDVSKIDAGQLHLSKEIFDVNKVLRDSIELMEYSQHTHHINFITGDRPALIYGNAQRIEQVFINLLNNAVKYSPDAKEVIVSLEEKNNKVSVSVKDLGIGISTDKLTEIFSRFYKNEESTRRGLAGLGIGLYISSQITEKHYGKLWAESEPGKGSTFCVELPVARLG